VYGLNWCFARGSDGSSGNWVVLVEESAEDLLATDAMGTVCPSAAVVRGVQVEDAEQVLLVVEEHPVGNWVQPCSEARRGAGGSPVLRRMRRMVEAPTRCPRRRSSPWTRVYPQLGLPPASRRISVCSSSRIGGRPGFAAGCRHFRWMRRRCHARSVAGVTSRWRRRTATSWRSTSISISIARLERPSRSSPPSSRMSSRWTSRSAMGLDHAAAEAADGTADQHLCAVLEPHRHSLTCREPLDLLRVR
jgi:hypothetical protein